MQLPRCYSLWLILLLMIMGGCIDEISFDSEFSENQLVVEGSVHNGPGPYTVHLGETQLGENLPLPLSDATIQLIDSNDNRLAFNEIEPGKYQTMDESFRGEPGETYHIEIELPDGRSYSSKPETMPLQTASSTVHLEPGFVPERTASGGTRDVPVVFVSANTDLPVTEDPIFLKWTVEGLYAYREFDDPSPFAPPPRTCFITEKINPQNILLFSGTQSGSGQIRDQFLTERRVVVQHKFFIRYYFNVVTTSITEQRYNYWQNVEEMINRSGTIFDVPPATVPGNIKNNNQNGMPALGYFEAVLRDTSREFITSSDFSFFIPDPCGITNTERHQNCYDCLEIENSTNERPPYF
ncbi:hypothetical protein BH23BAC3_BH23BAC3_25500 [soil metagenome]